MEFHRGHIEVNISTQAANFCNVLTTLNTKNINMLECLDNKEIDQYLEKPGFCYINV
mgnify:CR=1 FL=1